MEQEPIQTEEIEETPGDDDPQTQLAEMAAKLEKAEAELGVKAQEDRQRGLDKIIETHKASWLDFLLPKLDSDIGLEELEEIASTIAKATRQQKQIGEPTHGGKDRTERVPQALLEQAAEKARQSGKAEDRSYFSTLKQKLGGKY